MNSVANNWRSASRDDLSSLDEQTLQDLEKLTRRELERLHGGGVDTLEFIADYKPQILHPVRGWILFEPYDYQCEIIELLDAGESVAVNKGRQIGVSTAVMIQRLAQCMRARSTIVVTNKQDTAAELVKIAGDAFQRCEPQPPMKLTMDNALELRFDRGGRIKAEAASQNPGRSYTASCIVLDEFAYWPWQQRMWRAISPTISLGGCSAAVSTPDMEGDRFDELCTDAKLPGTSRHYLELDWKRCPEYGDDWYAENRPDYTAAEWASEFECEFGHASDAVFAAQYIEYAVALAEQKRAVPGEPRHTLGGDIAGEGRSHSVLVVLEVSQRPVKVVDVRSWETLPAPALQREIEKAAQQYDTEPWLDETGLGWGIVQNLGVRAVGVTITGGQAVSKTPHRRLTTSLEQPIMQRGWNVPRTVLMNNLALGLEQEQIAIPPEFGELVQGLKSFRWGKRVTVGADFVFALAIAYWAATQTVQQRVGRAAVTTREPITYV